MAKCDFHIGLQEDTSVQETKIILVSVERLIHAIILTALRSYEQAIE